MPGLELPAMGAWMVDLGGDSGGGGGGCRVDGQEEAVGGRAVLEDRDGGGRAEAEAPSSGSPYSWPRSTPCST